MKVDCLKCAKEVNTVEITLVLNIQSFLEYGRWYLEKLAL